MTEELRIIADVLATMLKHARWDNEISSGEVRHLERQVAELTAPGRVRCASCQRMDSLTRDPHCPHCGIEARRDSLRPVRS